MRDEWSRELDGILEELAYELTAARSHGLERPEELRASLKKARQLVDDADVLAAGAQADKRDRVE